MALTLHGTVSDNTVALDRKTATPLIINGDFGIWQRGTSFSITGNTYTTDRWNLLFDGTPATGGTITRQTFTVGQTDVPGNPKYYFEYSFPSVGTPSNYIRQSIEGVHNLSGKAVTGSFWAKCSSGTMSISSQFQQEFGSGGSPSSGIYGIGSTSFTATTSWQRFFITTTLGSISGKTLGTNNDDKLNFAITFPTTSSGTISIAQAQVEEGTFDANSIPPFQFEDVSTNLRRCQRYYQILNHDADVLYINAMGSTGTVASSSTVLSFMTQMRTDPTTSISFSNLGATSVTLSETEIKLAGNATALNAPSITQQIKLEAEL